MRSVAIGCVPLCVLSFWVSAARAEDAKSSPAEVLHLLQDLRRGILKAAPTTGHGVAELEAEIVELPQTPGPTPHRFHGGHSRSIAKHKVEFVFDGRDVIRREFHPEKDGLIVESYLEKGGVETHYWSGDLGPAPRSMSIQHPLPITGTGEIEWSYSALTSVPMLGDHDWRELPARVAQVETETKGDIVKVTVDFRLGPPTVLKASALWEFDRRNGMLTHYVYYQHNLSPKTGELEITEDNRMRWIEQGGVPVPAECTTDLKASSDGRPTSRHYHIVFKRFVLEAVDPKEFSVKNMGVLDQTPVYDTITGMQWKYGSEAETAGTDSLSTTPTPPPLDVR